MKRGVTREEIILATQTLITRNGIRAVRVDEIAQSLGISKRTLYETFSDKNELVIACLDEMNNQMRHRISACLVHRNGNAMQRMIRLANTYIDEMYLVDLRFILDICYKIGYTERFTEHQTFWRQELVQGLDACREEQLLLPEINTATFADHLRRTLFELRLATVTREELYFFSRTILRGAATQQGIDLIDRKH